MEIKVINLPKAKLRKEYMKSQLFGASFSFFEALTPNEIDEKLFDKKPNFLSKEAVATFESHRKIITSCRNVPLLVLEDDATPTDNNYLDEIYRLLKTKHSWDIMIIGYMPDYRNLYEQKLCDDFIKYYKFIGMHSYIINPLSVDKILNQLGDPITHIDYKISELIENDNIIGIFSKKIIFYQNIKDLKSQIPKSRDLKNEKNK
jgi:GR25 family glycosyltransferase involved in LPS biosynthesis